jgi:hypothetical protein
VKVKYIFTAIIILTINIFLFPVNALATDDNIAKLTIISDGSGIGGKHAFLLVENISLNPIEIGNYTLDSNSEVTVGTWGNRNEHKGIWYNLESYYINQTDSYSNRVSLSNEINRNELEIINETLIERDNWSYFNNCSTFASVVWNTVATEDETLYAGTFLRKPSTLSKSIKSKKNHKVNIKISITEKNAIAYSNKNSLKKPSFELF